MSTVTQVSTFQSEFMPSVAKAHAEFALPAHLRANSEEFAQRLLAFLFPHFRRPADEGLSLEQQIQRMKKLLLETVTPLLGGASDTCGDLCDHFADALPTIRQKLVEDAEALLKADPAAKSLDEVILAYPGFYAVALYRIGHFFYGEGIPYFPRLLAEFAHRETGIDIHPGAAIGRGFAIDHGTGVVIGETTHIGDGVKIYQGVTLGALSVSKDLAEVKRHPTLEDNVVVYANATILGGKTVVGKGSTIGGNVWLTRSVPPNSSVTHSSTLKRPGEIAEVIVDFQI